MGKFIRIFVLAVFIITAGFVPAFAMGGWHPFHGGHHSGGNHGSCGAPEIDPSVASSAIAFLAGGVLILTDRSRRKREQSE